MEQLLFRMLKEGVLSIPSLLIQHYKSLDLTDEEMMLILHIMNYKQEGKDFPTIHELKNRMTAEEVKVISMLQKLVQNGYLAIEDTVDKETGVRSEVFQTDPLYHKLAAFLAAQKPIYPDNAVAEAKRPIENLYTVFEQEFGRPLSPIECETLVMWQENDHYSDELIIAALREAVISGKLYFRYIDRILFEWQRNHIRTAKQAREYSLKFRKPLQQAQTNKKVEPFPFFNWLESDSTSST